MQCVGEFLRRRSEGVAPYVVLHDAVYRACVETVACSDGTQGCYLLAVEVYLFISIEQCRSVGAFGADEDGA